MNKTLILSLLLSAYLSNAYAQAWHLDTTIPPIEGNQPYSASKKTHKSAEFSHSPKFKFRKYSPKDDITKNNNSEIKQNSKEDKAVFSAPSPENSSLPIAEGNDILQALSAENSDVSNMDMETFFSELQKAQSNTMQLPQSTEGLSSILSGSYAPESQSSVSQDMIINEQEFDKADANHDNFLDEGELLNMSQQKIDMMTENTYKILLSSSYNDKIDMDTLVNFYSKQNGKISYKEELKKRFTDADVDENNELSESELKHFLQKDMISNNSKIFALFDSNQDGKISRDEVLNVLSLFKDMF